MAPRFGDVTLETVYRQHNRWAANGHTHKLGPGLYIATQWSPTPSPELFRFDGHHWCGGQAVSAVSYSAGLR